MKTMKQIPKLMGNPAVGMIEDALEYFQISQKEMADRLGISSAFISSILRGRKKVSNELALRLEVAFNLPSDLLVELQSDYDYQLVYHARKSQLESEVSKHPSAFR